MVNVYGTMCDKCHGLLVPNERRSITTRKQTAGTTMATQKTVDVCADCYATLTVAEIDEIEIVPQAQITISVAVQETEQG